MSGSNTVFSDDIVDNQVYSADVRNDNLAGGGLGAGDLQASSVGTSEVAPNSLNGADVNESLLGKVPNADKLDGKDAAAFVDSCPSGTSRYGRICAGSDGTQRLWWDALNHCSGLGLRVPTLSEALALANNFTLPQQVGGTWTEAYWEDGDQFAMTVDQQGGTLTFL